MKPFILSLCVVSFGAQAQDSWNGPDKKVHATVSGVFGFAAANQWPNEPMKAFGVAMVPGLLKEVLDSNKGGSGFSVKDLAADALGAAIGVGFGNVLIRYTNKSTVISYSKEF